MAKYKCWCGANAESPNGCFAHKARKPLRVKPKTTEQIKERQGAIDRMWEFYQEIFYTRGPYSEVSGIYLGKEVRSYMVDHLLPKETFPEIMYKDWNVILVTLEEHDLKTKGRPLPAHKEAIKKAKEIYNNLFSIS